MSEGDVLPPINRVVQEAHDVDTFRTYIITIIGKKCGEMKTDFSQILRRRCLPVRITLRLHCICILENNTLT